MFQMMKDDKTCGMCLNVKKFKIFLTFSNDLTFFFLNIEIETPFTVMVFDQCSDNNLQTTWRKSIHYFLKNETSGRRQIIFFLN